MDMFFSGLTPALFAIAFAITLVAGTVKGMVGFALPMIMISGPTTAISAVLPLKAS